MGFEELFYDPQRDGRRLPTAKEYGQAEAHFKKALARLRTLQTLIGVPRGELTRATTETYYSQQKGVSCT